MPALKSIISADTLCNFCIVIFYSQELRLWFESKNEFVSKRKLRSCQNFTLLRSCIIHMREKKKRLNVRSNLKESIRWNETDAFSVAANAGIWGKKPRNYFLNVQPDSITKEIHRVMQEIVNLRIRVRVFFL